MPLKSDDVQIIFTNVPLSTDRSLKNNIVRIFNINDTLSKIFRELGRYSGLPDRYFKLRCDNKEYNYMLHKRKIVDIFDYNKDQFIIIYVMMSTKVDRQIFTMQRDEIENAPLCRKIKYINYLTKYVSNLPERIEIHKEYKKLFQKYKRLIFENNKHILA